MKKKKKRIKIRKPIIKINNKSEINKFYLPLPLIKSDTETRWTPLAPDGPFESLLLFLSLGFAALPENKLGARLGVGAIEDEVVGFAVDRPDSVVFKFDDTGRKGKGSAELPAPQAPTSSGCKGGGILRFSERVLMLGSCTDPWSSISRGCSRGEWAGVAKGVWSGVGDVEGEKMGDGGAVDIGELGRDLFERCCR